MKGDTAIFIGVGATLAAVVGLVWWGHTKKAASSSPAVAEQVGAFPDLKIGQTVFFDGLRERVTADPRDVRAVVDVILTDRSLVGVLAIDPAAIGFRGTIQRSSIRRVVNPEAIPTFEA